MLDDDALSAQSWFIQQLQGMLSRPEFAFPLAAAQKQYRDHYYNMSSGALLEDLFFDAFSHYLRQFSPRTALRRPPRGQKGWDYEFREVRFSHKVGLGPQPIAVLWDATVKLSNWNVQYPIVFHSAGYRPGVGELYWGSKDAVRRIKPLSGDPGELLKRGHRVWIICREKNGGEVVVWTGSTTEHTTVADFLPFDRVWTSVSDAIAGGARANEIDIFRSTSADGRDADATAGSLVTVNFEHRAGISVLSTEELQNVEVHTNNRALLMSSDTVSDRMDLARMRGKFVPIPEWFKIYAADRPPERYLPQRAEFDELFTSPQ